MNIIMGYIDGTISFCPYCGAELGTVNFISATRCEECGMDFYVIEGESDTDE